MGKRKTPWNNPLFKEKLVEEHGNACVNCGDKEHIEWHHIVPRSLGGNDSIKNIVPLCQKCHKAVHSGITLEELRRRNIVRGGRKRVNEELANHVFEKYISGEIGNMKANEMLGYKSNTTRINGRQQFKDWMKEHKIVEVKNNIDINGASGRNGLVKNMYVGYIKYEDGRTEYMFYNDTGLNDIDYVKRGA